jgi:hypothetical protein
MEIVNLSDVHSLSNYCPAKFRRALGVDLSF